MLQIDLSVCLVKVISKGDHLFLEITNLLTKLKAKCFGSGLKQSLSLSGSIVEFDDVEKLLMQEKADFEVPLCCHLHFCDFL